MENQENKLYHLTCLFDTSTNTEKINQIIEETRQIITSNEGTTLERNYSSEPIKKNLAYPMKKQNEAFYWDFNFSLSPKIISKLEQTLRHKKSIIRYIVTNRKELKKKIVKKPIDFKIIDKIEPLPDEVIEKTPKKEEPKSIKEKIKIEDLDKKLEEILNQ
ncbi:MAG: 30S ribosomal protein S6 [Patescibacteria group bacterium]|nr:30S ribosomal protein S6 [Patescibacteria group bacterium]